MNFTKDYYTTGNYRDYLARRFDGLADDLRCWLGLVKTDSVLDFGCGCGGLLAALSAKGYSLLCGTDISVWAIEYGREHTQVRLEFYNKTLLEQHWSYVLFLDVLEHMPEFELDHCLRLCAKAGSEVIVRVPVSFVEGELFALPQSNSDVTHITCHTREWWLQKFHEFGLEPVSFATGKHIYDTPEVLCVHLKPCQL